PPHPLVAGRARYGGESSRRVTPAPPASRSTSRTPGGSAAPSPAAHLPGWRYHNGPHLVAAEGRAYGRIRIGARPFNVQAPSRGPMRLSTALRATGRLGSLAVA